MKVVFFGTPEFAVPSLKKLITEPGIEILAVVTQPDKAVGRKQIITAPPIKVLAEQHNIKVFQPEKLNRHPEQSEGSQERSRDSSASPQNDSMANILAQLKPDFIVTCAYGQILKKAILDLAPVINVHASLLPDYRGPAPINWMLIHGETKVGITTMLSDEGVDTGDILLKSEIEINENVKADELSEKLSELGSELLIKTLQTFSDIKPEKQKTSENPEKQLAPFMDKNLGKISFRAKSFELRSANPKQDYFKVVKKNTAENIHNLVRGTYPWPGAYFMRGEQKIIILDCHTNRHYEESEGQRDNLPTTNYQPGQISAINKKEESFSIQSQEGELVIKKLKAQGKSELSGYSWLNGLRLQVGDLVEN